MSITIQRVAGYGQGSEAITQTEAIPCGTIIETNVAVGAGVSNVAALAAAFARANLEYIFVATDHDVTLKTNTTTGVDTPALKAGIPFAWRKGSGIAQPFSADVTKFYFDNAGAADAAVVIRIGLTA